MPQNQYVIVVWVYVVSYDFIIDTWRYSTSIFDYRFLHKRELPTVESCLKWSREVN